MSQDISCPECRSDNVECATVAGYHQHRCLDCGYDGTAGSAVGPRQELP